MVIEYPVRETVVNDETDESWRGIYVFFFSVWRIKRALLSGVAVYGE